MVSDFIEIRRPRVDLKKVANRLSAISGASAIGALAVVARYATCLALPCWVFWRLSIPMLQSAVGFDEQVFVWTGWSILKGLAPYKDFMEWKPPMVFLTHALALKLFGFQGDHFPIFLRAPLDRVDLRPPRLARQARV